MDRSELTAALKKVSPALSGKDLIAIFACFCFAGDTVFAYDDLVSLSFPLKTGLSGGVRGSLLLNWLSASKAKEVEIVPGETSITLKAGRAKLESSLLPADDFLFSPADTVDVKKATEVKLDEKFLAGLNKASVSLGRDPSHPTRLGVTVVFSETGTLFYASDNVSAVRVRVGKPDAEGTAAILPPRFVELLHDIGKSDPPLKLFLTKKWAEVRFTSGLRLFSRTVGGADLKTFVSLFDSPPLLQVEIPKSLDRALERAATVAPYSKDPFTRLTVAEGRIKLLTESTAGNVADAVKLEGTHDDATAEVHPDHLKRGLPHAEFFWIMADRVWMSGPGFTYLVATVQRGGDTKADAEE